MERTEATVRDVASLRAVAVPELSPLGERIAERIVAETADDGEDAL